MLFQVDTMNDGNDYLDEILQDLTPIEKKILLECGKYNISIKKNISEETIKKKMPNSYMPKFNKSIKSLLAKGLLVKYRNNNFGLSKDGRTISKRIKEKHQNDLYDGLRILMLID